jgi:hypothetical protein
MLKVTMQPKGFNVKNILAKKADRKQLSPLQKKCMDVIYCTQKVIEEVIKVKEAQQMDHIFYEIVLRQTLLPQFVKANNEDMLKLQLNSLKTYLQQINLDEIPRVVLKPFLAYRKQII